MRIDVSELHLPGYVKDLLKQAIDESGHPLRIEERFNLYSSSDIQIARPGVSQHFLTVSKAYRCHIPHLLVRAAYRILRFPRAPPSEHYVAELQVGRESAYEGGRQVERMDLCEPPWSMSSHMSAYFYRRAFWQLTSYPVDLRVELEIADDLPYHRDEQRAYLMQQARELDPPLAEDVGDLLPAALYFATGAMNSAFEKCSISLVEGPRRRIPCKMRYRSAGDLLVDELYSVKDAGLPGDRILTDTWATSLDLQGWYRWKWLGEPP